MTRQSAALFSSCMAPEHELASVGHIVPVYICTRVAPANRVQSHTAPEWTCMYPVQPTFVRPQRFFFSQSSVLPLPAQNDFAARSARFSPPPLPPNEQGRHDVQTHAVNKAKATIRSAGCLRRELIRNHRPSPDILLLSLFSISFLSWPVIIRNILPSARSSLLASGYL